MVFTAGLPHPDAQKARHVHAVDLVKLPAAGHQGVVGGVDVVRQRQAVAGVSVCGVASAAFVGKSESTSVVCVCTAMSARAMSCISRSTG